MSNLVGWLPVLGVVSSFFILGFRVFVGRGVKYFDSAVIFLACANLLVGLGPLFFQFGQVSVAGAFTSNPRYASTVVALSGITIMSLFTIFVPKIVDRHAIGQRVTVLVLGLTMLLASYVTLTKWMNVTKDWQLENVRLNREVIDQAEEATKLGGNWVVTDYSMAYGVQKKPLFMFSAPLRKLLLAKTEVEVRQEIDRLCVVVIAVAYPDLIYRGVLTEMPFFRIASSYPDAKIFSNYRWVVLKIPLSSVDNVRCIKPHGELSASS